MGCVVSKKSDEEDDVVSLCKERKRLLKMAVERRYALADAQCKYNHSLHAVAAAIRLFVARYSSPSSPFLITFPSSSNSTETTENLISSPMFLQQRPSEPTHETISCPFSSSAVTVETSGVDTVERGQENPVSKGGNDDENVTEDEDGDYSESEEEESTSEDQPVCEHFYDEMAPAMPSPKRDFAWDFFYPFEGLRTGMASGFGQHSDEDLRAVREKEGIPDLEEDGERVPRKEEVMNVKNGDMGHKDGGEFKSVTKRGNIVDGNQEEQKSLKVMDTPVDGRELLEALKDVEDHFIRAYDSGLDVSRMLETKMAQMQPELDQEIKGGFFFSPLLLMYLLFVPISNCCLCL